MTAGGHGPEDGAGGAPQEDDPFGYLYRPAEGAPAGEQPQAAPRTAYRPMEVGRAQYGQQAQYGQAPYGQQPPYPPQGPPQGPPPGYPQQPPRPGHGEPNAQLPHQQPRYAERSRPRPGEDAPRGRGKGAVIGVVAVIAAIAIGAGVALTGNDGTKKDNAAPNPTGSSGRPSASSGASTASSAPASQSASPSAAALGGLVDASKAQPGGGATLTNAIKGAVSADGSYLQMQQGSTATFTVTVPTAGLAKIWLHYGNTSGGPVHVAVSVNGQDHQGGTTFKSWDTGGDPTKSWSFTWVSPQMPAGTDTIVVTTTGGPVMLDQMTVTPMSAGDSYPGPNAG